MISLIVKKTKILILFIYFIIIMMLLLSGCTNNNLKQGIIKGTVTIDNNKNLSQINTNHLNSKEIHTEPVNSIHTAAFKPYHYIIKFKKVVSRSYIKNEILKDKGKLINKITDKTYTVKLNLNQPEQYLESLKKKKSISYIEREHLVFQTSTIVNDPQYHKVQPWNLKMLKLKNVWEAGYTGSSKVKVAVIDTGIYLNHPDLKDNIIPGKDFIDNDNIPEDTSSEFSHGTHVAGIIGAVANNSKGITGINWDISIMPIRVMGPQGGTSSKLISGIRWAVNHNADIINLSLATMNNTNPPQALMEAVRYAHKKGVLLIGASGNNGANTISYPARFPEVISVGAINSSKYKASYSNYGSNLNLVAPGNNILSTNVSSKLYSFASGTSMAAPHVTGIAAILYSTGITSSDRIKQLLLSTADDLGPPGVDPKYGAGLVNINRALKLKPKAHKNLTRSNPEKNNNTLKTTNIKIFTVSKNNINKNSQSQLPQSSINSTHPDQYGNYSLATAPGNWKVVGWLDHNNNKIIDKGDYFGETRYIKVNQRKIINSIDINLTLYQ